MPSNRSRSRSPRHRSDARSRSRTPERAPKLPKDASPISEADYFQKSGEFRLWLTKEKGKYFIEMSGEKARSYFRKFVKSWNQGKLPTSYYEGVDTSKIPATTQTTYKWSFASKGNRADSEALQAAREEVGAATYNREAQFPPAAGSSSRSGGRVQGPTLPSASDLTLAQELASEYQDEERKYKRKRGKADTKERIEEMVGPREVGREGMLEKKRMRRENDRMFRDKGDEGLEVDESTLMGGGDSFQAQLARREAGKKKYDKKHEEKNLAIQERSSAYKEKEKATMDMFQQLAKQRFG